MKGQSGARHRRCGQQGCGAFPEKGKRRREPLTLLGESNVRFRPSWNSVSLGNQTFFAFRRRRRPVTVPASSELTLPTQPDHAAPNPFQKS